MGRITAAPVPCKFGDGTEYYMSPLTDIDMDELDEWVQSRVVENAQRSLRDDMSPAEREEVLGAASRASVEVTWLSGIGAKLMSSIQGMSRIVWLMARHNHAELKLETVRAHLLDQQNLEAARLAFEKANAMSGGSGRKRNPQQGRRRPKR